MEFMVCSASRVDADVVSAAWPWADAAQEAIATNWNTRRAALPDLFDGRVLLMRTGAAEGDVYRASFFETDFSRFLAWNDFGRPEAGVRNGFSMAAVRTADDAWLLGVMGQGTANAGKIYFPAGTPDPSDVRDGRLDLAGSAMRELEEETGLTPADVRVEEAWHVAACGARVAFLRPIYVDAPAREVAADIEARLRAQTSPELAGIVVVRRRADLDRARIPDFLLHWFETVLPE